ncbi:Phospholipase/lecithinase/hemolysin [hydrothermal vent metagenome]|uniref:Phospholipase/lecithinase/hemolysin n=1 Tax=hydrothermal vent metagenome TaxID=652676 RepID=A0A3B0YXN2_9ZZZZ
MTRKYAVTSSFRRLSRLLALCTVSCLMLLAGTTVDSFARDDHHSGHHKGKSLLIFGDSLSDTGNAAALGAQIATPPFEGLIPAGPYSILRFTNGRTWVEHLAKKVGAPEAAKAVFQFPAKGRNYAVGGARARLVPGGFNLQEQVGLFLSSIGNTVTRKDRVVIALGGNDVRDAIVEFGSTLTSGGTEAAAQVAAAQILCQAVASIEQNVSLLHNFAGAKRFFVMNSPDLGLVPAITVLGSGASALGTKLSGLFNRLLASGDTPLPGSGGFGICALTGVSIHGLSVLESSLPGIEVMLFDVFSLLNEVVADPQVFHLSNGTDACITPGVIVGAICQKPQKYIFWDGIHPTAAMHRIVAHKAAALLPATPGNTASTGAILPTD